MLRIPSTKERIRKVRGKHKFFDDAWFDKKAKKRIEKTHDKCSYCRKKLTAVDMIKEKGKIVMTCNTPGCPGNMALNSKDWDKKYRGLARQIDKDLVWEMKQITSSKPWKKLWANRRGFI